MDKTESQKKKTGKDSLFFIIVIASVLLLTIYFVSTLFIRMINDYQDNTDIESASHLTEINYQIKLYIEDRISNDWSIAHSVVNSLLQSTSKTEDGIYLYMQRECDIWGVSNIIIYTEDGFGIDKNREVMTNDKASDTVYRAHRDNEYMAIVQSSIVYTLPIKTDIRINGSEIAAISIVQDVTSFLDNMEFSSFDSEAYMYLTMSNGIIVSRLSHPDVTNSFNIKPLLERLRIRSLSGEDEFDINKVLTDKKTVTGMISDTDGDEYIISTPVITQDDQMRLFYFVPKSVVNRTMDGFTTHVTIISILIITVFSLICLIAFIIIYRSRKLKFDKALLARDRMFDLLVKNTSTAFELLSVNEDRPLYHSSNIMKVLGIPYAALKRLNGGFEFVQPSEGNVLSIAKINEKLAKWDGTSEFVSDYMPVVVNDVKRYFNINLYPVEDSSQEYIGILQDTTNVYNREEAVKEALKMAERSNAAKDRFLSNMSHDIRTPMNAIVNMTDFAIESVGDPETHMTQLKIIRKSSEHLLSLINDVLDMSRIESGQVELESESFDLEEELIRISEMIQPLCQKNQLTFVTDFSQLKNRDIIGDRLKMAQILMNLLSNAVKFTRENGTVKFSAEDMPSIRQDIAAVRFIVEDNGIGIPEEYIEHIFEPFSRADDKKVVSIEGTGLGLSICQSYVKAMGGSIQCESEEGKGSVFKVELFFSKVKLAKRRQSKKTSARVRPFAGKRCLLVEDNEINQTIARTILERTGFIVEVVSDGSEGLGAFTLSVEGYYDIIYMDIRMPVMNGYEATERIRKSTHPQAVNIPIVAMTANVFAEDVEKSRVSGMNGHIGKPVITSELIEITENLLK